jgi:tRNA dimethylallyltransferase
MPAVPENQRFRDETAEEDMEALRRRFLSSCLDVHNTTDLLERKRLIRAIEIVEFTRDHPHDSRNRMPISPLVFGLRYDRETLRRKITTRLKYRLDMGMIEEVRRLREKGIAWERIDSFGLEYRYIGLYLQGKMSGDVMFQTLNTRIGQYAKRQETWFRRMEKNGVKIHWIDGADESAAIALILHRTA